MNNNKNYIVRSGNVFNGSSSTSTPTIDEATVRWKTFANDQSKFRKVITKNTSSLPQIAIKRKNHHQSAACNMTTEVVLLNGNWDTSNKIPNIIAEMHNVNVEELQNMHNTCNPKQNERTYLKQDTIQRVAGTSPPGSDSGIEADCSDGNLSWLLNYKIHELPPVPDISSSEQQQIMNCTQNNFGVQQPQAASVAATADQKVSQVYIAETVPKQYFDQHQNVNITRIISESRTATAAGADPEKPHGHTYRYSGPKKPPFTYTELIEHALCEKGELTVSGIYQWISDHFPFYKQNDDRWKNSVRHNLSINPHFRKGCKAVHGAGHLWTIAQKEDKKTWNMKKQRMQQFMQTTYNNWNGDKQLEMEVASATASILPEHGGDEYQKEASGTNNRNAGVGQANGKRQSIEVEYVNVIDMSNGLGDFLCPPVSKEEVVEECGLGGDYLITDLNPTSLGLNLAEAEIISGGNLYDDLNFQCYELQTE